MINIIFEHLLYTRHCCKFSLYIIYKEIYIKYIINYIINAINIIKNIYIFFNLRINPREKLLQPYFMRVKRRSRLVRELRQPSQWQSSSEPQQPGSRLHSSRDLNSPFHCFGYTLLQAGLESLLSFTVCQPCHIFYVIHCPSQTVSLLLISQYN